MATRTSNLLALTLATVIALGAGEIALRLLTAAPPIVDLGSRHGADVSVSASESDPRRISNLYLQTDQGLRLRPGVNLEIERYPVGGRRVRISSDELGMRRVEHAPVATDDPLRILFIGDSVTFGEGVSDDETFVQKLDGHTGSGGRPWRTFNGGIPGYGLANEIELLADVGRAVRPDVAVLVFYLNDAIPSPSVRVFTPPSWLGWSWLVSRLYVVASRVGGRVAASDRFLPEPGLVHAWQQEVRADGENPSRVEAARHLADWGVAWSDGVWAYLEPLVARFAERSRELGASPVLMVSPLADQIDVLDDFPQRRIREIGRRVGVPVVDLLPGLREDPRGKGPLFLDHCHYSPQGHALVADVMRRELAGLVGNGAAATETDVQPSR